MSTPIPPPPETPTRKALSNMQQRVLTGALGIVFFIGALWSGEWGYAALMLGLTVLCQWEFYKLLFNDGALPLRYFGTFAGVVVYAISFLVAKGMVEGRYYLLMFPVLALVYFIKLYKRGEVKPFEGVAYTFLGIAYTAVPFALLNHLVFITGRYEFEVVMGILLLLWASDSGAYFAGVNFGKTKLFERVSPKKSWEGSIGGAIASGLTAWALSYWFHSLAPWQWLCASAIIVVAGTYGDLVESLFKRSIAIKDSGSLLPGHGGFLDRFDGLLLSLPFLAAFLLLTA